MRPFVLIAIAALALGACRDKDQADTSRNAASELTAENIVANDVTAIDAVTADAANMAADVDYTEALTNLANDDGAANVSNQARPRRAASSAETSTNLE